MWEYYIINCSGCITYIIEGNLYPLILLIDFSIKNNKGYGLIIFSSLRVIGKLIDLCRFIALII